METLSTGQRKIEIGGGAVKPRVDLRLYRRLYSPFRTPPAEVVELVDALASGASGRKPVGVRVPPSALSTAVSPDQLPAPKHRFRPRGCVRWRIPRPRESRELSATADRDVSASRSKHVKGIPPSGSAALAVESAGRLRCSQSPLRAVHEHRPAANWVCDCARVASRGA